MAREKPLDVAVVQAWQAAWSEAEIFSDAAVRHLQSFIPDPLCLVVVTLGVGREPRSLVFRRIKRVVPVPGALEAAPKAVLKSVKDLFVKRGGIGPLSSIEESALSSMFVSPVAPARPSVGQLWHQTGVKSEKSEGARRLERVLRWDGEGWPVVGYVTDSPTIMKQGMQACDFQEALAYAHETTR